MKVLMICNTDGALYVFRKPIIKKLIELGHEVVSISSESQYFERMRALGVRPFALDFARHSVSLTKNLGLLIQLYRFIRQQRPDIVHSFTHKPAIYGTVAARMLGMKRVFVTITGLGTLFIHDDVRSKFMRWLLLAQYRMALQFVSAVFFQNPDDMEYLVSRKIVKPEKAILTYGSGIDLEEFPCPSQEEVNRAKEMLCRELNISLTNRRVVLFPARGVPDKGFFEFYEAAKIINLLESDKYVFIHLGLVDHDSIRRLSRDRVETHASDCGVYYLGFKDNIRDYMIASDIVVLPSYGGEGTPRSLIEALALGKAVVTTDVPGCRETVIDGWNGFFCKPCDASLLSTKILSVSYELINAAKARSRHFCEEKFDAKWLVDLTLNHYVGEASK